MKKSFSRIIAASLAAAAILLVASCSAKFDTVADSVAPNASSNSSGYVGGAKAGYEYSSEQSYDIDGKTSVVTGDNSDVDDTRKIVKTIALNLETKEFDKGVSDIIAMTVAAGGYVESSYVSGRSLNDYGTVQRDAWFTLRVPAAGLDGYVGQLSGSFNVLNRQDSSTDITDSYYDSKARLDSLLLQEERLLSMLGEAGDLEYMLKLEDKLSEVRYQIESLYSTLQRYDKSVEMATVSVTLREVVEYKKIIEPPKTFGERLWQSFVDSWTDFADGAQDFAVGFVYALPTLLLLAIIITIIALPISRAVKRKKARKAQGNAAGQVTDQQNSQQ